MPTRNAPLPPESPFTSSALSWILLTIVVCLFLAAGILGLSVWLLQNRPNPEFQQVEQDQAKLRGKEIAKPESKKPVEPRLPPPFRVKNDFNVPTNVAFEGGQINLQGEIADTDRDPRRPALFHKAYRIILRKGRGYDVEVHSVQWPARIRVEDSWGEAIAPARVTNNGIATTRAHFLCPETKVYLLFVGSDDGTKLGEFTLIINERLAN